MISWLGQSNKISLLTIRADWSLGISSSVSGYLKCKKKENGQFTSQNIKYNITMNTNVKVLHTK